MIALLSEICFDTVSPKCTEVQDFCYILNCYLGGHECIFRTNNTRFMQANMIHGERRYYCTRIPEDIINTTVLFHPLIACMNGKIL